MAYENKRLNIKNGAYLSSHSAQVKCNILASSLDTHLFDVYLFCFHGLIFLISASLLIIKAESFPVVIFSIISALLELSAWAVREIKYNGKVNWIHPVPLFVSSYCIVYYQLPYLYLGDFIIKQNLLKVMIVPENISFCVILAAVGLAAFFCGEQFLYLKKRHLIENGPAGPQKISSSKFVFLNRIRFITLILAVFILIFFLLFLKSIGGLSVYFGFPYGDQTIITQKALYYQTVFIMLIYVLILFQIKRIIIIHPHSFLSYVNAFDKVGLLISVFVLIPFILSGDRGTYFQIIFLLIVPYFLLIKHLNLKTAIISFIIVSLLFAFSGEIRGRPDISYKDTIISGIENLAHLGTWPTMELAGSFGTFNMATYYFPDYYSYNYGLGILAKLSGVIPFVQSQLGLENLNMREDYKYNSSLFFTYIINRGMVGSGAGSSSLADAYIEFGTWGIPIIMFLWGVFIGWVYLSTRKALSADNIFIFSYLSYFSIYVNRSSFFFGWNTLLWAYVIYLVLKNTLLKESI
jgi:oligosaccharide repeat unit polymerase